MTCVWFFPINNLFSPEPLPFPSLHFWFDKNLGDVQCPTETLWKSTQVSHLLSQDHEGQASLYHPQTEFGAVDPGCGLASPTRNSEPLVIHELGIHKFVIEHSKLLK